MPTENRSSNTELSKIVTEALVGMVSGVTGMKPPADEPLPGFIQAPIDRAVTRISGLLAQPAPQPHPDPIAWMVGTAIWWTKEEAERDAADTGLPIVGLGPMAGVAPAEQHQGEPVGWQFYQKGKWWNGDDRIKDHRKNTEEAGIPTRDVFVHADPGEVERLAILLRQTQVKNAQERDALRAHLAEAHALLRECQPCLEKSGYGTWQIDEMLSASAEPSAPVELVCNCATRIEANHALSCPRAALERKP